MTKQSKNNNLNFLLDPTFSVVKRFLVLSFENEDDKHLLINIIRLMLK